MQSKPHCLVISSVFPPINAVGIHRTVALCRHLVEKGWLVTVITARPQPGEGTDAELLERVPRPVRVIRTAAPNLLALAARGFGHGQSSGRTQARDTAHTPGEQHELRQGPLKKLANWLSFWLHVPDFYTGWLVPAVWAGIREACRQRPQVIYSTAPMWTGHLIGGALSSLLRAPWVADFRDPWCGNPWRAVTTLGFPAHRRVDALLESLVVHRASRIACAFDQIRQALAARYPKKAACMATVYNGFDPDQIDPVVPVRLDDHHCVLFHAGVFYGPRSPAPLLEGLKRFQEEDPAAAGNLRVALVGPPTYEGQNLDDLARRHGVEALVRIILPVPYRKALAYLKGADVAILFGQTGEGAVPPIPAKAYEYIGAGKPVLAVDAGEEALDIMRRGGCRVWPVRAGDPAGMAAALREIATEHRRNRVTGSPDSAKRLEFTREHMSESLESLLQSAIDSARTRDKTRTMNSR